MRRKRFAAIGLMSGLLMLEPGPADAQTGSLDLDSSVTASCVDIGFACSALDFRISLVGAAIVDHVRLVFPTFLGWILEDHLFGSMVQFNEVIGAGADGIFYTADDDMESWDGHIDATGSAIDIVSSAGRGVTEPLIFRAFFTTAGTTPLGIEYQGHGFTYVDPVTGATSATEVAGWDNTAVSFGGTVTPEPVSMLLLGTGLAGVGAVRRRRRAKELDPSAFA